MKHKKLFVFLALAGLILAGYFLTAATFPKNLNRYPMLVVLLLLDYYVWGLFKKKVYTYSQLVKTLSAVFYWFPLLLLIASTAAGLFVKSTDWPPLLRNLIFGTVFIFYITKLIMALILGLADLFKFFKLVLQLGKVRLKPHAEPSKKGISRSRFMEQLAMVTGGLMVTTMFTGMFRWVHDFDIKRVFVPLKNLPDSFDGYRIIQLSDLHLGTWSGTSALEEAVEMINLEEADLVVFTGDLVNYTTEEAFRFKSVLSKIKARDGVLAILGNHDYGDYVNWPSRADKQKNMEALYRFYQEIGWKLLRNENYILEREGEKLAVIGVENWSVNERFPRHGNILKASKGIGKVNARILLSHDPSHWSAAVLKHHQDIGLTLSGHTHGFQFGIELPGLKWSPAQYVYQQWAGQYEHAETQQLLYVNRGIGSIGYPGRIGILPEITVIELKS